MKGTYKIANTTTSVSSPQLTTTVTNGNIIFPTDTAYSFSGTKTVSIASGNVADVSSLYLMLRAITTSAVHMEKRWL
ncbi:MAG: hypothetical protein M3139_12675 [Bacteroidota bacterium]|nr:hypothetical protein [Bacteroidota bacterium]